MNERVQNRFPLSRTQRPSRTLRRRSPGLVAALMLALLPISLAAAQEKVNARYATTRDVSFRLSGSIGTLRIVGWDRDSVVVTGVIPAGVRLEGGVGGDGRAPARGVKMYLESPNDLVSSTAALEVRVPRGARVWVKSGTADIDARDITGGLDLNVIGGRVSVSGSPRELQVEAMDASVLIDGSPGWLRAKTASGDILLRGGSDDLGLTSVSGALRVEGGTVSRGRLETVTGAITFAATAGRGGALDFDSHSGRVDLTLSDSSGFTLTASSITGAVENRFNRTTPSLGREGRGAELTMDTGNASARITVRTFRGTIVLHR
ncbi:MAG: DUF4097 family beta strand repeat-containing protein [Gemmatimonadota bacterium]